jgi:hypothetical protein
MASAPAVVAAADFSMVPQSPKRPRLEEADEVRRTSEAQARTSSHCNMNINIHSAADSQSLHRGTGEPARSTSQHHFPDCSAGLWRTQQRCNIPQPETAPPAKAPNAPGGHFFPTIPEVDWRSTDQRKPSHRPGTQHGWVAQERRPPGRGPKARRAIAAPRQPTLIFTQVRHTHTDRPPPPTPQIPMDNADIDAE